MKADASVSEHSCYFKKPSTLLERSIFMSCVECWQCRRAGSRMLTEIDEAFFDTHFSANVPVNAPLFIAKSAAPLLPSPTTSFLCPLFGDWLIDQA